MKPRLGTGMRVVRTDDPEQEVGTVLGVSYRSEGSGKRDPLELWLVELSDGRTREVPRTLLRRVP